MRAAQRARLCAITCTASSASEWREDSDSILLRTDFGRLLEKHGTGVYTLVLWVRIDGESVVVAGYSIFHGITPPDTYGGSDA